MIDKEIKWNITLGDALSVNKDEDITILIDRFNYNDIFNSNILSFGVIKLLDLNSLYFNEKIHDKLSPFCKYDFDFKIALYPNEEKTSYKIGYDIKDLFSNLLDSIDINYPLVDIDYNDEDSVNSFKKHVKEILDLDYFLSLYEYKNHSNIQSDDRLQIISNLDKNINYIVNQMIRTNRKLDELVDEQVNIDKSKKDSKKKLELTNRHIIIPKNLLMYSAAKSLSTFRETGNIDYYRYSKDYYNNISNNGLKPEWPKTMMVDGITYNYDFKTYNEVFNYVRDTNFPRLFVDLGIEDKKNISIGDRTLKQGSKDTVIKLNNGSKKKDVDYDKIKKMLDRKITFYKGLQNQGTITSLEKDTDYIGFVLNNNYVIFDKFYELNKDGTFKKVAKDNAIYAVSLDVLDACHYDKKEIRKYIKENKDYKAFRFYHNDTDSYQERVNEVSKLDDISFKKFKELTLS